MSKSESKQLVFHAHGLGNLVGEARKSARFLIRLAVFLVMFGCGTGGDAIPCEKDPRCLRYGISAEIPVLDPHSADSPEAGMIFRQLYDTLIYRDSDTHEFLPGLAREWEVSADGLAYTFHLRQDVIFHDGSAFNAASVAKNIQRIFDPVSPSSLARELLGPLRQYEIPDAYTIRLHLTTPYASLLDGLTQPYLGIASPEALNAYEGGLRYQFHQSGTGPFMLEDYLPGERIVLRRYEGYRVSPAIYSAPNGNEIDRVEFSILNEGGGDVLSLIAESFDIIDDISPADAQNLSGNSRIQIMPAAIPGQTVQLLFNTNREHLNIRDLRMALLLATNRVAMIDQIFFNTSPVAWAPLSATTGYAHTGYINVFAFELEHARELLSAAGYTDVDGDGVLDRAGEKLTLTMVAPPWGRFPEVAEFLKAQWRQIGIDLLIELVPGISGLTSLIQSGEIDILPVVNFGIDPGILGRIFLDTADYRFSRATHDGLDSLLRSAAQEMDPLLRRNQYYDVQAVLMNEALTLPLREYVRLTAASAAVGNLHFDAYGFYPLLFNTTITNA